MIAKPTTYRRAGWTADHNYHLAPKHRRRLVRQGLTDQDLIWVEEQMKLYSIAATRAEEEPTQSDIAKVLKEGSDCIASLMDWIENIDDASRDLIEDALPVDTVSDAWRKLTIDLSLFLDKIEMARRSLKPKAGRRPTSDKKDVLTRIIIDRFGEPVGIPVVAAVLEEPDDTIKRRLRRTE